MQITIQPCVFGHVLIGASPNVLMAVELGETPADAVGSFINRWNTTRLTKLLYTVKGEPDTNIIDAVLKAVNEGMVDPNLKLALYGSRLQREIWDKLRTIPPGISLTYKDIAEGIEHPLATRAVGTAIGANPIAIIVPCHRVVRSDGKMGGYRWGEDIKRKLLEREKH